VDISAFFGFLRRRGLIVLLAAAVGAVAGYALSKGKDDEYTADATLLLRGGTQNAQGQNNFSPGVPEASQDRIDAIKSDPVEQRAVRRLSRTLGERESAKLVDDAEVTSGEDSGAVTITVTAPTAKAAAATANALALGAIDARRDDTLRRIRRALRAAQADLPGRGQTPTATDNANAQQVANLRQAAATADGSADLTSRATEPSSPSAPKPKRDAVIGGFAGLLLGFVLAMVREQLDRRVKGSRELEDAFGLPVLANVPRSRALGGTDGRALDQLPPAEAESFQMLRANLRFLNTDKELRSVVVTSPGVGDGKSTVSLNLAKADASVGKRVLLIEADMRRPKLAALLGMGDEPGLAAYLADPSLRLVDVARRVPVSHHGNGTATPLTMDVLVSGSPPSNPAELVNSQRMIELVEAAERDYELVVIDTSPAGLVADAIPLMSRATAVLIVGRVGRITDSEADSLRNQLERIDAPAFGLVANFAGGGDAGYGYY
jgi:capsular exopolysaccharide synthesis family protein